MHSIFQIIDNGYLEIINKNNYYPEIPFGLWLIYIHIYIFNNTIFMGMHAQVQVKTNDRICICKRALRGRRLKWNLLLRKRKVALHFFKQTHICN